ncbi:MAG TPA: hypothetical protein VIL48_04880 [Acidimicrobiales bacterium]
MTTCLHDADGDAAAGDAARGTEPAAGDAADGDAAHRTEPAAGDAADGDEPAGGTAEGGAGVRVGAGDR